MKTILLTLAQADPVNPPRQPRVNLREVQYHFSGDSMIPIEWIVVATGLVLLVIGAMSLYRWWKTRHLRSNPMLVYYQIGVGLDLSLSDLWLLYRIARREHLPTPLTLMMSPNTLHHHAERYVERMSPGRAEVITRHVARISRTVFGGGSASLP